MTSLVTRSPDHRTKEISPRGRLGSLEEAPLRRSDDRAALIFGIDSVAAISAAGIVEASASGMLAFLTSFMGLDLLDRRQSRRFIPSALDDTPMVLIPAVTISAIATALGLRMYGDRLPIDHEATGTLVVALIFVVLAVAGRVIAYGVIRRTQAAGRITHPALIVGTGPVGNALAWRLLDHPEYGLTPVGFLDGAPPVRPERLPAPMLGDIADLPRAIVERHVRHVFVAFTWTHDADLVDVLRACDRLDCEVYVVPRLFELGLDTAHSVDHLWGVPLLRLRRAPFRSRAWTVKRILDITVAATALLLLSPLLLAIALGLRVSVGPGAVFRQTRVGLDGQPFQILKFRTLKPRPDGAPTGWSAADENAMSALSRFLRRSSLDELPQLWNVLRGQMSLVGPRPEMPSYVSQFVRSHRGYDARLRVPAGITGWAQIHDLRGATSLEDRVRFDNFYIEHWSLWRDINIGIRTVASMLGMRGG
jgi:exopolysaccharide biosynthesis polyprenyl glycosylphosphotransferase